MIVELEIDKLDENLKDHNKMTVIFISPNYEKRSLGLFNHLIDLIARKIIKNYKLIVIKLQSKNHKVDILEDLKMSFFNAAITKLNEKEISFELCIIGYPDHYSPMTIHDLYKDNIDPNSDNNIIFDFSCLPKTIIIDICKFFSPNDSNTFYFCYSSPKNYPRIRHPQAIGEMRGMLKSKSLNELTRKFKDGTLITFPSDLGYSGHLISDQIARSTNFDQYLFIYLRRTKPLHAYDAMSGNIYLLSEAFKEWRNNIINHFTIQDGFRKLQDIVNNICDKISEEDKKSYIVLFAPFGPKPLIVGCYLMVNFLESKGIAAEIVQESSFQYSSVYSIGFDKLYLFQIEKEDSL